jgi:hypothetical protein
MARLVWHGKDITEKVVKAAKLSIDQTLAQCVLRAKKLVPVKTSALQGSIQMRAAERTSYGARGEWGSYNIKYAIFVETGTNPHMIYPRNKKALYWPGASHPVKSVRHPGTKAQPFLVPAAREEYPKLGDRIKENYRRG